MPNLIESGPNVNQSWSTFIRDLIISRGTYSNVFCEKRVAEISSKILEKQLRLSSFFVKQQTKLNSFKILFKDFSSTIRTSFLQSSSLWVIVVRGFLTPPMFWRPPFIVYSTKFCPTPLFCCLQPSPPLLFLMSCFFD